MEMKNTNMKLIEKLYSFNESFFALEEHILFSDDELLKEYFKTFKKDVISLRAAIYDIGNTKRKDL